MLLEDLFVFYLKFLDFDIEVYCILYIDMIFFKCGFRLNKMIDKEYFFFICCGYNKWFYVF